MQSSNLAIVNPIFLLELPRRLNRRPATVDLGATVIAVILLFAGWLTT